MENESIKISIHEIIELISEILNEDNINELTTMENCSNWDSLSHATIVAIISDKFKVEITPELFSSLISIKEIYNFLNK